MTNIDVDGLPSLFKEITEYILSVDNNDLIKYLENDMKSIEEFYLNYNNSITDIVNNLTEKKTYHKYSKIFIFILKYFLIAV
jgi:hypothetical protein